jgi:hypothetical protein
MKGEVRLEVQVLYLDSASEVGDVRGVFDVPLKVGGDLRSPRKSRRSDKHKKNMNDAERSGSMAENPTC